MPSSPAPARGRAVAIGDLSVRFDTAHGRVDAIDRLSLTVEGGDFVTLIGPSGCGKSTLLRVVADLVPPTTGAVEILGGTPDAARASRRVAFVFQESTLLPWRSALRNVQLPYDVGGRHRGQGANRPGARSPEELLRLMGLGDRLHALPHQLSGGQRQRVAIARALVGSPELLLMDEPFGALDEITRDRLNDELLDLWRQFRPTILFVTHSLAEAIYLGQRVVVFAANPGRIREIVDLTALKPDGTVSRTDPRLLEVAEHLRGLLAA